MFYSLTATTNWAAFCQCMRAIKAAVAATATPAAAVKKAADPTRACKVSRTHTHTHRENQKAECAKNKAKTTTTSAAAASRQATNAGSDVGCDATNAK